MNKYFSVLIILFFFFNGFSQKKGVKVENSLRFHKSLNQNGIKNEMHIYPYGGHGYSLATGMGQLSKWPDLLIDWIKSIN